ncbi:MAG: hypothetical protein GXX08_07145, partial [Firmicutes bacterium]|nr:hypothetical protein [Bacillota bacterium]
MVRQNTNYGSMAERLHCLEVTVMLRDRRPNVVVFFTDQQRWDTAGV